MRSVCCATTGLVPTVAKGESLIDTVRTVEALGARFRMRLGLGFLLMAVAPSLLLLAASCGHVKALFPVAGDVEEHAAADHRLHRVHTMFLETTAALSIFG